MYLILEAAGAYKQPFGEPGEEGGEGRVKHVY